MSGSRGQRYQVCEGPWVALDRFECIDLDHRLQLACLTGLFAFTNGHGLIENLFEDSLSVALSLQPSARIARPARFETTVQRWAAIAHAVDPSASVGTRGPGAAVRNLFGHGASSAVAEE